MGQIDRMRYFSVSACRRDPTIDVPFDSHSHRFPGNGTLTYQGVRAVYSFRLSIRESEIRNIANRASMLPDARPDDSAIKILSMVPREIGLPPYLELDGPYAIVELADPALIREFREELGIEYVPHTA